MFLKMHMHCEAVVRFLVCLCLVGFAAAAKCQPETCGSENVSFPFWIDNPNCGQPGFRIICEKNKYGELTLFLPAFQGENNAADIISKEFKIMKINYTGSLIINSTNLKASSCDLTYDARMLFQVEGPFTISASNRFVVIGCVGSGTYSYGRYGEVTCKADCYNMGGPRYCNYGCCETVLADNWKLINFTGGGSFHYYSNSSSAYHKRCAFSTVFEPSTFTVVDNETELFWGEGRKAYYGLRLNWGIGHQRCSMAKSMADYSCDMNAECLDSLTGEGYACKCLHGYKGSGYSNGTGCIDVDECSPTDLKNDCATPPKGICHNLPGSFSCSCAKGYKGNGRQCEPTDSNNVIISTIIGSVSSIVGVFLGACVLFWWLRRRRLKDLRDKYFRQNGGLQHQDHIASMGGRKNLTLFSEKELDIASNNYSTELGRGGFATVYHGVLLDGMPVAIKKPKAISGEFSNEIMMFSHINHRNIVKLHGCCLQTQFPLLVCEFVPNGTLYEHLHSAQENLPWETRRQIATEAADAIAYMHLQASQPILHRDIKSSNILLDNTFTPKVADFGISRLRPSDETHLSTMAMGTLGYVDPEFVRSNQFTDKSDVFSFGVVLLELLSGLKPLLSVEGTVCNLYDHFLSKMNQNRLTEILDPNVVTEVNQEQMENMARLAKACVQVKSKARPSMREVVDELAWIRAATTQSGLHTDVSLVEHRGDSKQTKLNDYSLLGAGESSSQDLYPWPASNEITTSEDPSSSLMSDMDAR